MYEDYYKEAYKARQDLDRAQMDFNMLYMQYVELQVELNKKDSLIRDLQIENDLLKSMIK